MFYNLQFIEHIDCKGNHCQLDSRTLSLSGAPNQYHVLIYYMGSSPCCYGRNVPHTVHSNDANKAFVCILQLLKQRFCLPVRG